MQSQIGCSVLSSAKIQDCSPAGSSSLNILQWSVEERSRPAGGGTRSRSWLPTVFGVDLFMPGNFATTNKGGFGRITQRITRRMESCTRLRVHQCLLLLPVASFFFKTIYHTHIRSREPAGPHTSSARLVIQIKNPWSPSRSLREYSTNRSSEPAAGAVVTRGTVDTARPVHPWKN